MRSSRKLRLAPLWPALAALGVMALAQVWFLPPLFERAIGDQLLDSLRLVEKAVAPSMEETPRQLQERVTRLAAETSLRITVIRPDGTVLADSDRTWAEVGRMGDHSTRPEVREALAEGAGRSIRRSDTTGRRYLYVARPFRVPDVAPAHVLRVAQPLDELTRMRGRMVEGVVLALLATLLVIGILSVWLDRRLLHPLAALIDGARALAAGRYDRRLEVPEQRDLADLAKSLNRMTSRVEEQIAAVEKERDHLHAILSSMSEGVLVVDDAGRAVLANPAFRRLFSLPRQVEGRLPFEVTRRPELATVIQRTLAEGEARVEEVVLDDGPETRTAALAGSALRLAGGPGAGGPGAVVVAQDTTETTRLTQMRRDFVANVSHELKTPLSAIRGYAETLRDGALEEPPVALRFTGRILEQCRRLQEMLDDLLILSRLESVEIPLESRPVDLVRLSEQCLETVASRAEEREIRLSQALPSEGLPPVAGDRSALERLILNLLENAIKYNRPGGEVELRLEAAGDDGDGGDDEVRLEVRDTGIGIPADALPRIFERFYRVDKGRAREEGGTGLGLAIVKHVAQAHGGRVEVESSLRTGSVFRVHLPRLGPEAARPGGAAGDARRRSHAPESL